MPDIIKTMKLHIKPDAAGRVLLEELADRYAQACGFVSEYVFNHGFPLNYLALQNCLYQTVRGDFGLKAQMTQSVFKTVTARYKTVKKQLSKEPYRYKDEKGEWVSIPRTLEWLWQPIQFKRPQADLVRGRDYSFVHDPDTGKTLLSLNTLEKRIRVPYDLPEYFLPYFDGSWSFGTGKIISLKGEWYFHIPMTKECADEFDAKAAKHVVGIDRGLRFLYTAYDETEKTTFMDGSQVMAKREAFQKVRSELQARGTKSAKRALKRISGRENRWMSDVNHQMSKTLVVQYGECTLFVLEDLAGVSFAEKNLSSRTANERRELRSWPFYQFGQFLTYKAQADGSGTMEFDAAYTSQRCPKCGRIRKENRRHGQHEYICDCCGYRSNDDRVASMNIQFLGTLYVSGDANPRFGPRKAG